VGNVQFWDHFPSDQLPLFFLNFTAIIQSLQNISQRLLLRIFPQQQPSIFPPSDVTATREITSLVSSRPLFDRRHAGEINTKIALHTPSIILYMVLRGSVRRSAEKVCNLLVTMSDGTDLLWADWCVDQRSVTTSSPLHYSQGRLFYRHKVGATIANVSAKLQFVAFFCFQKIISNQNNLYPNEFAMQNQKWYWTVLRTFKTAFTYYFIDTNLKPF